MAKDTPKKQDESKMPLSRHGIILLAAGLGTMILGYILMCGGKITDPNVFNWEMFSFQRTVLAPVVILIGIGIEIYAIMQKK